MPVTGPPAFPNLSFLTYEMGMIPLCLVWGRMERSLTGKAGPKHRAWHTTNAQESTSPSSGRSPKNNEKGQHPMEGSSTAAICIVGGRGKNYWGSLGWCRPSKNPFPFLNPPRRPSAPTLPLGLSPTLCWLRGPSTMRRTSWPLRTTRPPHLVTEGC